MIYVYGPTFFDFKVSCEDRSPTQIPPPGITLIIASISNKVASIIMELEDFKCKLIQCKSGSALRVCTKTSKKSPYVCKSWPKMISPEK